MGISLDDMNDFYTKALIVCIRTQQRDSDMKIV